MQLRRAVIDTIIAHARADAPLECCGLLIGSASLVESAFPAGNLRKSEVSFLVDPADHFAAIRRARARGKEVVGAYHSHPRSPAAPSDTDIREAIDPGLLHVIVSLATAEPEVKGYRIRDGKIVEVPLIADP